MYLLGVFVFYVVHYELYFWLGCGYMGVVLPSGSGGRPYVRRVERGDVVALPKGSIYWWYNGGDEVHRVLIAADISSLASPPPTHYNVRRRRRRTRNNNKACLGLHCFSFLFKS